MHVSAIGVGLSVTVGRSRRVGVGWPIANVCRHPSVCNVGGLCIMNTFIREKQQ